MNRRTLSLYLLLALAAAGCGRIEARSDRDEGTATINRTWPAAEIKNLKVFEIDGSVTVEAGPTNEVVLVAKARGDLDVKPGQENQGLFETRLDGDTLRIGRHEDRRRRSFNLRFFFDHEDVEIHYALKVPPSVSLDVKTVNGRITTKGVEGETDASTVNGTIDIETAGLNELSATTVNGRVRAKFVRGFNGARFKTVNGSVKATLPQDASFNVSLSQVNGDFEASFPLSIHSHPGSRRVSGEVNGGQHALKITTVNGDVELARLNDSL